MIAARLKLPTVCLIKPAECGFQRGFNLSVGGNGVGKSTVLEVRTVGVEKHPFSFPWALGHGQAGLREEKGGETS